jgi:hypothetical protein
MRLDGLFPEQFYGFKRVKLDDSPIRGRDRTLALIVSCLSILRQKLVSGLSSFQEFSV